MRRGTSLVLALLLSACAELSEPPVATVGNTTISIGDVRRAWADLPVAKRPSFETPESRLLFVDSLVDRHILLEEARERIPDDDPELASAVALERRLASIRRMRVVLAGQWTVDPADVEKAYEATQIRFVIDRVVCPTAEAADRAYERAREGASSEELQRDGLGVLFRADGVTWTPTADATVDMVADLAIGEASVPFKRGPFFQIAILRERQPRLSGPFAALRRQIAQGLRTRRNARVEAEYLVEKRTELDFALDEETVAVLTRRTREAILASELTEHDGEWAIPPVSPEEEQLAVATWSPNRRWTVAQYREELGRGIAAYRPSGGFLESRVRHECLVQIDEQLLWEEARRRGLDRDWWVERAVRRAKEEYRLSRAQTEIAGSPRLPPEEADSLAAALRATRPDLFDTGTTMRLLRFDFSTPELAREEIERIRAAGGGMARVGELLEGDVRFQGSFHVWRLKGGGFGDGVLQAVLEQMEPGELKGPIELLANWSVVECLDKQPGRPMTQDEIRETVAAQLRRGRQAQAVREWLDVRRRELRVAIDEEALDALGPGT